MPKGKNTENYIDNKVFYQHMLDRHQEIKKILKDNKVRTIKDAKKKGVQLPPISDYIGDCLLKIADRLSRHPWFSRYTDSWKEEMKGDAIENCLMYLDNFNPKKTKNPFSYYTQITWYAFRRRIEREKKHQYIKMKALQQSSHFDNNATQDADDKFYKNEYIAFLQKNITGDIIETFEKKKADQKQKLKDKKVSSPKKKKTKGKLDKFLK